MGIQNENFEEDTHFEFIGNGKYTSGYHFCETENGAQHCAWRFETLDANRASKTKVKVGTKEIVGPAGAKFTLSLARRGLTTNSLSAKLIFFKGKGRVETANFKVDINFDPKAWETQTFTYTCSNSFDRVDFLFVFSGG